MLGIVLVCFRVDERFLFFIFSLPLALEYCTASSFFCLAVPLAGQGWNLFRRSSYKRTIVAQYSY